MQMGVLNNSAINSFDRSDEAMQRRRLGGFGGDTQAPGPTMLAALNRNAAALTTRTAHFFQNFGNNSI